MTNAYTRLLRTPGAISFSGAGAIARFPATMFGIASVLAVQELYGTYGAAGAVSAANIIAMAVCAPWLARLVDRHGQARVMVPCVLGASAAMLGIILAAQARAPIGVLIVLAAVAGALTGSLGTLVRARWSLILDDPGDIHTAFSLEAAVDEIAFILGPILATALATSSALPPTAGWAGALVCELVGGLGLLAQRRTEPPASAAPASASATTTATAGDGAPAALPDDVGRTAGPGSTRPALITNKPLVAIAVTFLAQGLLFGANDVTAVAFATELGHKSASGLVLGFWGMGALVAAVIYGSRSWSWPMSRQFITACLALSVGCTLLMLAPNLVVLGVIMALTGMSLTPSATAGNSLVQASAPASRLTEALTWLGTSMYVGNSLGALIGGNVVDAGASRAGYALVAVCAWASFLAALASARTLRRSEREGTAH